MLIRFTTSTKTTFILLMFTLGSLNSHAHTSSMCLLQNDTIVTVNPSISKAAALIIPENARKETINFQVNSEISYFSFSHFVKSESKEIFYAAWQKEKEVGKLSAKTDSLRKSYAESSNDQKEKISTLILKAEEHIMTLNEEIPVLYEKARNVENQYWQSASADEKNKVQGKVRSFQDSIKQATALSSNKAFPDTITYYKKVPKPVVNTEPITEIIYKIQVGAFKGKLPDTAAKSIKKLGSLRKVESYKDEKGITLYTTGNLKRYQDAVIMQGQVKLEGIKNATIVAYNNGKKINLDDARKLTNESVKP